jgi:hypothetical protein
MPKLNDQIFLKFSPCPPSPTQIEQIINDFCDDTSPSAVEESGCAVCGQLKSCKDLTLLQNSGCDLNLLIAVGVTRKEWLLYEDPVTERHGPVIDDACKNVCHTCLGSLQKGKVPKHALASGLWLGAR